MTRSFPAPNRAPTPVGSVEPGRLRARGRLPRGRRRAAPRAVPGCSKCCRKSSNREAALNPLNPRSGKRITFARQRALDGLAGLRRLKHAAWRCAVGPATPGSRSPPESESAFATPARVARQTFTAARIAPITTLPHTTSVGNPTPNESRIANGPIAAIGSARRTPMREIAKLPGPNHSAHWTRSFASECRAGCHAVPLSSEGRAETR